MAGLEEENRRWYVFYCWSAGGIVEDQKKGNETRVWERIQMMQGSEKWAVIVVMLESKEMSLAGLWTVALASEMLVKLQLLAMLLVAKADDWLALVVIPAGSLVTMYERNVPM